MQLRVCIAVLVCLLHGCAQPLGLPPEARSRFEPKTKFHLPTSLIGTYRKIALRLNSCLSQYRIRIRAMLDRDGNSGEILAYSAVGFRGGPLELGQRLRLQVNVSRGIGGGTDVTVYDITGRWHGFVKALKRHLLDGYEGCTT